MTILTPEFGWNSGVKWLWSSRMGKIISCDLWVRHLCTWSLHPSDIPSISGLLLFLFRRFPSGPIQLRRTSRMAGNPQPSFFGWGFRWVLYHSLQPRPNRINYMGCLESSSWSSCEYEASSSGHLMSFNQTAKLENTVSARIPCDGWLVR